MYAHWRFTGNSLNDFSGNGHPLEVPAGNTVKYASTPTGPDGTYALFDATTSVLVKPSFTMPPSFSFCSFADTMGNSDRYMTLLV